MVDVPPLQQELLAAQAALAAMPVPAQGADATEYMAAQDKVVRLWSAQAEVEKLAWMRSRTAPPDAGLLTGGTVRWTGPGGGAVPTAQDWSEERS